MRGASAKVARGPEYCTLERTVPKVFGFSLHHVDIDIITQGYSHVRILMWFVRSLNRGD